jgi:hypothetical protein
MAELRVGQSMPSPTGESSRKQVRDAISVLSDRLDDAATAAAAASRFQAVEVIRAMVSRVRDLGELDSSAAQEVLFDLEPTLLDGCLNSLPAADRNQIVQRARESASSSGAVGTAWERTVRAMVDKEVRRLFRLPRLEIL